MDKIFDTLEEAVKANKELEHPMDIYVQDNELMGFSCSFTHDKFSCYVPQGRFIKVKDMKLQKWENMNKVCYSTNLLAKDKKDAIAKFKELINNHE